MCFSSQLSEAIKTCLNISVWWGGGGGLGVRPTTRPNKTPTVLRSNTKWKDSSRRTKNRKGGGVFVLLFRKFGVYGILVGKPFEKIRVALQGCDAV
jgi:hypothetical protein